MILRKRLVALAALSLPIGPVVAQNAPAPTPASVPGTPTDTAALLRKIEDQERRIEALEHKLQHQEELEAEASQKSAAERAATPTPASTSTAGATAAVAGQAAISATNTTQAAAGTVIAGPSGLFIQSNDGANVIRFRGNLAVDGRWYSDHVTPETADTWLFRRVRPYFEGTLDRIYDFRFMPDFGNGKSIIVDAFVTATVPRSLITAEALADVARIAPLALINVLDNRAARDVRTIGAGLATAYPRVWALGGRAGNTILAGAVAELDLDGIAARAAADPSPARLTRPEAMALRLAGTAPLRDEDVSSEV